GRHKGKREQPLDSLLFEDRFDPDGKFLWAVLGAGVGDGNQVSQDGRLVLAGLITTDAGEGLAAQCRQQAEQRFESVQGIQRQRRRSSYGRQLAALQFDFEDALPAAVNQLAQGPATRRVLLDEGALLFILVLIILSRDRGQGRPGRFWPVKRHRPK